MSEIWYQTTSHQQRRILTTPVLIYCWEMRKKHPRDVTSNNITSTKNDFHHACVHLLLRDEKETSQRFDIRQHHLNKAGCPKHWCSSVIERWKANTAEMLHRTKSHQCRRIPITLVFMYCLEMERKHGRDVTYNSITSTEKDFQNPCVHLLFRDRKKTWQRCDIKQHHINREEFLPH